MPPMFQPTRGGARKRSERADNMRHFQDENTDCEEEVREIEINAPSPVDGSSSSSDSPDLMKGVAMKLLSAR
ncbi:hypothetical protein HAX54_004215 [Datura stramonium]|uniref:Uncharacterized protein n=1 Tax=Datura stramonium TaxID=4076 RepID=A0ABS8WWF7_DATST|nr:hypothetical protein [Datura stramonium]